MPCSRYNNLPIYLVWLVQDAGIVLPVELHISDQGIGL